MLDLRYAPPAAAAPAAPAAAAAPATPAATVEAGFGGEMTQARKKKTEQLKKINTNMFFSLFLVFQVCCVAFFFFKSRRGDAGTKGCADGQVFECQVRAACRAGASIHCGKRVYV